MATQITEVRLLNVPLSIKQIHTFYFNSISEQTAYFKSKTIYYEPELSYQRKDTSIRFPKKYDEINNCNYLMYKNSAYSDKWIYAFITDKKYISQGLTEIQIKTDPIQTRFFDYTVKASFVEREHVNDDTIGMHTVPEGLETGEYKVAGIFNNSEMLKSNSKLILATTVDLNNTEGIFNPRLAPVTGDKYNGLFSGVKYYVCTEEQAKNAIALMLEEGQSDALTSVFIAPDCFFDTTKKSDETYYYVSSSTDAKTIDWNGNANGATMEKPTAIDKTYTPKNNKLLTYPYCYMLLSNNAGGSAIYRFEAFSTQPSFKIKGSITPGMSIRAIPQSYNGILNNNEEGLTAGKYPICSWANDVYTNWLTQTSVNRGVNIFTGLATVAISAASIASAVPTGGASIPAGSALTASLAGVGGVVGGVSMVGNSLGQVYQQSFQPPQASGNTNSGDVTYSSGFSTFTAYTMTIKKEYAKIIDGFFDMYGYKVNEVKVPNKNHRENYWYTKLIDPNITAPIPQDELQEIQDCYSKGITFWKNPDLIGDYSVSNNII